MLARKILGHLKNHECLTIVIEKKTGVCPRGMPNVAEEKPWSLRKSLVSDSSDQENHTVTALSVQ
jgi:hypothetical protein